MVCLIKKDRALLLPLLYFFFLWLVLLGKIKWACVACKVDEKTEFATLLPRVCALSFLSLFMRSCLLQKASVFIHFVSLHFSRWVVLCCGVILMGRVWGCNLSG